MKIERKTVRAREDDIPWNVTHHHHLRREGRASNRCETEKAPNEPISPPRRCHNRPRRRAADGTQEERERIAQGLGLLAPGLWGVLRVKPSQLTPPPPVSS